MSDAEVIVPPHLSAGHFDIFLLYAEADVDLMRSYRQLLHGIQLSPTNYVNTCVLEEIYWDTGYFSSFETAINRSTYIFLLLTEKNFEKDCWAQLQASEAIMRMLHDKGNCLIPVLLHANAFKPPCTKSLKPVRAYESDGGLTSLEPLLKQRECHKLKRMEKQDKQLKEFITNCHNNPTNHGLPSGGNQSDGLEGNEQDFALTSLDSCSSLTEDGGAFNSDDGNEQDSAMTSLVSCSSLTEDAGAFNSDDGLTENQKQTSVKELCLSEEQLDSCPDRGNPDGKPDTVGTGKPNTSTPEQVHDSQSYYSSVMHDVSFIGTPAMDCLKGNQNEDTSAHANLSGGMADKSLESMSPLSSMDTDGKLFKSQNGTHQDSPLQSALDDSQPPKSELMSYLPSSWGTAVDWPPLICCILRHFITSVFGYSN